MNEAKTL